MDSKGETLLPFYYYVGVLLLGCLWYFQAIVWSLAQEGYQGGVLVFNDLHVEVESQNFLFFIRFLVLGDSVVHVLFILRRT